MRTPVDRHRPSPSRRSVAVVLAVLAVLAVGCSTSDEDGQPSGTTAGAGTPAATGPAPASDEDELAAARQRWADAGIDDYSITYQVLCFCDETVVTVEVEGGEAVNVLAAGDGAATFDGDGLTVDDMFAQIGDAFARGAAAIEADYDPSTGRPVRYLITESEQVTDTSHGVSVVGITFDDGSGAPTPTDPAPTGTAPQAPVAGASLVTSWECGTGFHASDADQTLDLAISAADVGAVVAGATGAIGDGTWTGELRLGRDLFAEWCSDLPVPGAGTPVVDATWPVVAGTVEVTGATAPECPGEASIELTGIVVTSPDGAPVELGSLSITNEAWTCLAG